MKDISILFHCAFSERLVLVFDPNDREAEDWELKVHGDQDHINVLTKILHMTYVSVSFYQRFHDNLDYEKNTLIFKQKTYTIYFILNSQHFLHLSGSKQSVALTTRITLNSETSLTKFQTNLKPEHSSWMRNRIVYREIWNTLHSVLLLTHSFIYLERLLSSSKFSLGREQTDPWMQCQHLSV